MLIGLHGKAGSGKDQSYQFINQWAPARREAFADRMKISAAKALGYQGTDAECLAILNRLKQPGWQIIVVEPGGRIEHPISGREYIQYYGTEAHREVFGQDFWVELVTRTYSPPEVLVVTDVRFPNEAEAIRALGGEIWHIIRPSPLIAEDWHVSETTLPQDLITRTVANDGDLSHLQKEITYLAQSLALMGAQR